MITLEKILSELKPESLNEIVAGTSHSADSADDASVPSVDSADDASVPSADSLDS